MKEIIDVFTGECWTSRPVESVTFDDFRLENWSSDRGRSGKTISSIETIEPTKYKAIRIVRKTSSLFELPHELDVDRGWNYANHASNSQSYGDEVAKGNYINK